MVTCECECEYECEYKCQCEYECECEYEYKCECECECESVYELKTRDPATYEKVVQVKEIFKNGLDDYIRSSDVIRRDTDGEFVLWLIEFVSENGRFPSKDESFKGEITAKKDDEFVRRFYIYAPYITCFGCRWRLIVLKPTLFDIIVRKITYIDEYEDVDAITLTNLIKKGYTISPDSFENVKNIVTGTRKHHGPGFDFSDIIPLLTHCNIDFQLDIENSEDVIQFDIKKKFDSLIIEFQTLSYQYHENLDRLHTRLNDAFNAWKNEERK